MHQNTVPIVLRTLAARGILVCGAINADEALGLRSVDGVGRQINVIWQPWQVLQVYKIMQSSRCLLTEHRVF